ncbi:hypothetical protein DI392_04355 [Vibrio albus]|jgi:hypothetical protein|uniref:Uncharacterized protein n=1 Tax=Vibrio albus TaxID=2200953 RepID=A0A2U3BC34_9VIBR|nr:hypothetical protein [Vibrio albus]PWI34349.1 hypothetical protein DI392_04355 [Vibrio albus]
MDRDLLARKLYVERVSELVGQDVDEATLTELWESKATPAEAAKTILEDDDKGFEGPAWLSRYLNRK